MARIINFDKKKRGWVIGSLPMPDGSKRSYKEYGKNALSIILDRWQRDRADMLAAAFLNKAVEL